VVGREVLVGAGFSESEFVGITLGVQEDSAVGVVEGAIVRNERSIEVSNELYISVEVIEIISSE